MRFGTINRLSQISSAVVTSVLVGAGCHPAAKPPAPVARMTHPSTMVWANEVATPEPTTLPTTVPATSPVAVVPATSPAAVDTALATAVPATVPTTVPTTIPPTLPAAVPSSMPAVTPATLPTTEPAATQPTTQATTQAAAPTTQGATQETLPPMVDAPPPTDRQQIQADVALAERLAGIAELEFASKPPRDDAWNVIWRHQAALLSACASLDPHMPRYPRLVANVMGQLHDREGEVDALRKAVAANNFDEFSWNRRLDLIMVPMQTAVEKIAYLRDVISRSNGDVVIPANVRAHAAYRCAQLLLDRSEDDAAAAMLSDALKDSPSNVECLTLRYAMLPANAPVLQRCQQLLDILHANPMQARYSNQLATLIADAGLVQESLPWFQLTVATSHLQGDPAKAQMLNWGAELYLGDEKQDAAKLNAALLQIDPNYTPSYFLQLTLIRGTSVKDAYAKGIQQATNAMTNRVVDAANAITPASASKATTRPIDSDAAATLPDLPAVAAIIKQGVAPQASQQFIEAVSDLAFLNVYFAEKPEAAAPLIEVLQQVLPADAPELARLRGWSDLMSKKPEDAKAKFSSVAADDPLSELGLIKVMLDTPADRATAESMGRRLLADHPSGLMGALLWEQLRGARVKIVSTTQSDAIREAVTQFPASILHMIEQPQNFYAMRVQPHPIGSRWGEPLLADVIIQNLSEYDLTIGADGMLKPEMLFSVNAKLDKAPTFTAFDTLATPTALGSHSHFEQVVRIDQTQLLAYLNSQPNAQFEVTGTLNINETAGRLGGYPVTFAKSFYRMATPNNPANQRAAVDDLTNGRPEQKIAALSLLERYIHEIVESKTAPDSNTQQALFAMIAAIHHARVDALPAVAAWACKTEYSLANPTDRVTLVRDMAENPDWRQRQIALLLVNSLEPDLRKQIVTELSRDPQSSVRADATALLDLLALPPMPATQPATPAATPVVP